MNAALQPQTGERVRVVSDAHHPRWLRKATVEKVRWETLLVEVRYSDGRTEWVQLERVRP